MWSKHTMNIHTYMYKHTFFIRNEVLTHAITWMNLENIMLSKMSCKCVHAQTYLTQRPHGL